MARGAHGAWWVARRTGCMTGFVRFQVRFWPCLRCMIGFARFQIRSWLCLHNVATLRVPRRPRGTSQKPLLHNSTCWLPVSGEERCGGCRMERHQRCQDADEDGRHGLCVFGARMCVRGTQIQFTDDAQSVRGQTSVSFPPGLTVHVIRNVDQCCVCASSSR